MRRGGDGGSAGGSAGRGPEPRGEAAVCGGGWARYLTTTKRKAQQPSNICIFNSHKGYISNRRINLTGFYAVLVLKRCAPITQSQAKVGLKELAM